MKFKIKVFTSSVFLSVGLLGIVGFCSASTIFTDDFNSYTIGANLNGQGGWTASQSVKATNFSVKEGAAAVFMIDLYNTGQEAIKSGDLLNDGQMTIYLRRHTGGTSNPYFKIFLKEGDNKRIEIRTGGTDFRYWNGSGYVNFGAPFLSDAWYALQVQWRSSDHTARYSIDGETWTQWAPTLSTWSSGVDTIDIIGVDGAIYFDTIQENLIGVESKTPVLIVPGLMGTELFNDSEKLWLDALRMFTDIGDNFMDTLQFQSDLTPINSNINYGQVIFRELTLDYADGLINEFKNKGYVEGETLFTFPYDWRYGVSGRMADGTTEVDLLTQKISEITAQTGSNKVDVIAHSLGGLLVKKYAMDNPASHHIGKAVFVGVPNTGAPKAIKSLLEGDNFGIPWLSQGEIKKIAENMPAAYDLLPTQKYYDAKGSFVKVIDQRNFSLSSPEVTATDLNYGQFEDYITLDHQLNAAAFGSSENIHTQSFDDFDLRMAGVDVYAIDGCKEPTITNIIEKRSKNILGWELKDYNVKFGAGDGTVTLESATNLPIDQSNKYFSLAADHSKMLSADGVRQQIANILAGNGSAVPANLVTQDISQCQLNGKAISVFSPVDISATDQNGNRLGLAEDGSIVNEISNAGFEIMGEHKFLYLPTDNGQTYEINIKGKGEGSFTIKSQEISDNEVVKTEIFSNLSAISGLTGKINLGGFQTPTTLIIQQDIGSQPEIVLPSSIIGADKSQDLLPPTSAIKTIGTAGQDGFYRSDVVLEIRSDDFIVDGEENQTSGAMEIHYSLDGGSWQTAGRDLLDILVTEEGGHEILFFSTDNAGNNEPQRKLNFTIDKTPPEAIIEFNLSLKDLKFTGTDNISDNTLVALDDRDNIIILGDQAGNITEVSLENKNRKTSMSAELESLKYNGVPFDIDKNYMSFYWRYDKKGNLKTFSQRIKSRNNYSVNASYDGKQTKISGKDSFGTISKTIEGLQVIKVLTNKGDLRWSD